MEKLSFKVAEFEGPLDLLLHLISKHKLNIYDIPISALLGQYMEYIEQMKQSDMDVASEFLEMAARLVHIKTIMLLPRHEEDAQELKQELTGQLLEYSVCKAVAQKLREQSRGADLFVRDPLEFSDKLEYNRLHDAKELIDAYLAVAGKRLRRLPPPASAFTGIVARRIVSVRSRIMFVLGRIMNKKKLTMDKLYSESSDRSELVATFLAVLELLKGKRILLSEDASEIYYNSISGDTDWEFESIEEL